MSNFNLSKYVVYAEILVLHSYLIKIVTMIYLYYHILGTLWLKTIPSPISYIKSIELKNNEYNYCWDRILYLYPNIQIYINDNMGCIWRNWQFYTEISVKYITFFNYTLYIINRNRTDLNFKRVTSMYLRSNYFNHNGAGTSICGVWRWNIVVNGSIC